jgi:Calcineurin-like phosphoesterase
VSGAVARVAFASDAAGGHGGKSAQVAAAIDAAFGRFGTTSACWLVFGGDEYTPFCTAKTVMHYDRFFDQEHISPKRTVMTPGNHSNGPGGKYPDIQAWLAYNRARGTLTRTDGGWISKSAGIPLTDQFVDIGGIRFILVNSGAVLGLADSPGWPVPAHGGSVGGDPRVAWLRSAWARGTANVVVTHHPRWSYYGNHHDCPTMQNLVDAIMGRNDGSGTHASLILQGHDHNVQMMEPQGASGGYPGLTSVVMGLCSTAPAVQSAGRSNTSQKSWLQFANLTPGACAFLQIDIMSDRTLELSIIDASDTRGRLLTNTPHTGANGPATTTIAVN